MANDKANGEIVNIEIGVLTSERGIESFLVSFIEFDGTPRNITATVEEGLKWRSNDFVFYNRQKELDRQIDITNHLLTRLVEWRICPAKIGGLCDVKKYESCPCDQLTVLKCWKEYLEKIFPVEVK